jgi:hypothetical protein
MKYTLQIDGAAEYTTTLKNQGTVIAYASINDIPPPVRQKFVELRKAGQTTAYIAQLFSVPDDWVLLVTEPPIGSPEH